MYRIRQLTIFTRKQTLYQSKVTQLPMLHSNKGTTKTHMQIFNISNTNIQSP